MLQGVILVYDVTERKTFDSVNQWLTDITEVCEFSFLSVKSERCMIYTNALLALYFDMWLFC